ncbi:AAA family ATPase [Actinoplanes sp. NPDC051861]|uniref:NACHT domain-containing protein n=1 Tax=Actinoplanes sp. NPDC051861 TaxID=3155170 RepID=UPI00341CDDDD
MKLPLTYRSAVRLLGAGEPAVLQTLDTLLGGMILAAGAVAFPTGSAVLSAVWGWIDQKNELIKLLNKGLGRARQRFEGAAGFERSQLVAAAHTALVGSALFESLQAHLGPAYQRLELTEEEKTRLFTDADATQDYQVAIGSLLATPIEMPWSGCGFDENLRTCVVPYLREAVARCLASFQKLAVWERAWRELGRRPTESEIVDHAVRLYVDSYFRLASDVPEFLVWAMLGGQSAAQRAIKAARKDLIEALRRQEDALQRVETVLSLISGGDRAGRDQSALAKVNRTILDQPLIRGGEMDGVAGVRVPTVAEGYVVPRFRFAIVDAGSRPSSEEWWESRPVRSDLDEFLVGYLASARCTQRPLIVLGHPGAGKSLLTRVLTARLAATAFPAFLVPLRRVRDPSAPIYQQIQQLLDESTHARALWSRIADTAAASGGGSATRVVLLDGLDELMQATGTTESGYLSQVEEFQRVEATQDAPVAVIVTSRQVVADLANIPAGCVVLRLEDFTDEQVGRWVDIWNGLNERAAVLSREAILGVGPIVRQPLLLLMTAIQATTSGAQAVPADEAAVYRQLLVDFTQRELRKSPAHEATAEPPPEVLINDELWRLGITAYGMFNRGRQFVTEEQLQADLGALDPRGRPGPDDPTRFARPLSAARRTIGRFFFIHTSETGEPEQSRKTYEFLHATFAEYLIAHHAVDRVSELIDTFAAYRAGRLRPGVAWDDDEVLYALLSHRPIAVGGAIVRFTQQIFDALDPGSRVAGGEVLERLLAESDRARSRSRETGYNPGGYTGVQRLAAYVTNLVLLRLLLLPERSISLDELAPDGQDPVTWWRSVVRLMQSGLDEATWLEVLHTIEPTSGAGAHTLSLRRQGWQGAAREVHEAQLLFDPDAVATAQVGVTLWRGVPVPGGSDPAGVYADLLSRRLFADPSPARASSLLGETGGLGPLEPPLSLAVVEYLLSNAAYLSLAQTVDLAKSSITSADAAVRAVPLVVVRPELLRAVPELDPWYGQRLSTMGDFLRVGGAFALLNLIGSEEERKLSWPLYKTIMRLNAGRSSFLAPHLIRRYAALAAVADDSRAAVVPAVVNALTYELIRNSQER